MQSQIILSRTDASQPLNRHSSPRRYTIVDACKFYFPKIVAKPSKLPAKARKHGAVAAARARNALSGIFAWAMREGIVDANPVIGTNKPPEPPSRDRVLTDAELAGIWAACQDNDYGRIVKLALLTGARREEIGGLRWQEVDIDRAELTLPLERTKNGRPHLIPLSPMALSLVSAPPRRAGREYLFGEGVGAFSGWSKSKAALDRRIFAARQASSKKTPKTSGEAKPMSDWRHHARLKSAQESV